MSSSLRHQIVSSVVANLRAVSPPSYDYDFSDRVFLEDQDGWDTADSPALLVTFEERKEPDTGTRYRCELTITVDLKAQDTDATVATATLVDGMVYAIERALNLPISVDGRIYPLTSMDLSNYADDFAGAIVSATLTYRHRLTDPAVAS